VSSGQEIKKPAASAGKSAEATVSVMGVANPQASWPGVRGCLPQDLVPEEMNNVISYNQRCLFCLFHEYGQECYERRWLL
jgi:hypothetical protein